jgi:hypothetical protein
MHDLAVTQFVIFPELVAERIHASIVDRGALKITE